MKLRYKLWLVFSLLWLVGVGTLQIFIVDIYKSRSLAGQQQLVYSQGMTITDRINGLIPRFTERAEGYLDYYSQTFSTRLLLLDENGLTLYDSFRQLEKGSHLKLAILDRNRPTPDTLFLHTAAHGHVQYTLLDLHNEAQKGRLLIVTDANGIYDDIRQFRWKMMLFLGGASLIGFLICFGVATWFTRPIRQIVHHLERITPQNREFTMTYRRKDELGHLVNQIGLMVQQLGSYEKKQRQFMSASSHELKTPLATMQLITENLPHLLDNKQLLEEYIGDLQRQIDKMKLTVKSMLDVYRLTEHELQLTSIPFESICKHLEETFRPLAQDKGIELIFETQNHCSSLIADRSLLYSGLDNLMSNAIRYSPAASTIRITLLPDHSNRNRTILRICDEGIGIGPEDLPYIFEPFYRSRQAAAWNEDGSGFGLAMVKQMVELHEGEIQVESTPLAGTCFSLIFRNKR
jgi:signal transduction histidine kinase